MTPSGWSTPKLTFTTVSDPQRVKTVEKSLILRNETLPPPHQTLSLVSKTSLESFRILTKLYFFFKIQKHSKITCFQIVNTLKGGHPAHGDLLLRVKIFKKSQIEAISRFLSNFPHDKRLQGTVLFKNKTLSQPGVEIKYPFLPKSPARGLILMRFWRKGVLFQHQKGEGSYSRDSLEIWEYVGR